MSDQQKKEQIAALLREREGYERYGHADRMAEVDAQLDILGRKGKAPAKRAAKMAPKDRFEASKGDK